MVIKLPADSTTDYIVKVENLSMYFTKDGVVSKKS